MHDIKQYENKKGRKAYKFDSLILARIIEYSSLGYNITHISDLLGVSRRTLHRWIDKYKLKDRLESARTEYMSNTIERSLVSNTIGGESEEIIEEYVKEDEDGTIKKITRKVKKLPPCSKSAQILAKKYAPTFSEQAEVTQASTNINIQLPNTSGMSKRELQDFTHLSPLGAIDTTAVHSDDSASSVDSPLEGI